MTQYYCNICKKPISKDVYDYSMRYHKRPLCMIHQKQNKIVNSDKKSYGFSWKTSLVYKGMLLGVGRKPLSVLTVFV